MRTASAARALIALMFVASGCGVVTVDCPCAVDGALLEAGSCPALQMSCSGFDDHGDQAIYSHELDCESNLGDGVDCTCAAVPHGCLGSNGHNE